MPATVMRHPSAKPTLPCGCGCGGGPECPNYCPPMPDCGDRPPWGWWGFKLRQSWEAAQMLRCAIQEAVKDMLKDGSLGVEVPLKGVTDGSAAAPGMVGEFLTGNIDQAIAVGDTQTVVSMGILPPGDWNVWGWLNVNVPVTGVMTNLLPIPPGFQPNTPTAAADLGAWFTLESGASEVDLLELKQSSANVSVPTLMPMNLTIAGATAAGIARFVWCARRVR